jgi:hypothetical protein
MPRTRLKGGDAMRRVVASGVHRVTLTDAGGDNTGKPAL